jgi:hypothetical protein
MTKFDEIKSIEDLKSIADEMSDNDVLVVDQSSHEVYTVAKGQQAGHFEAGTFKRHNVEYYAVVDDEVLSDIFYEL